MDRSAMDAPSLGIERNADTPTNELTPEEVNEIIHSRRKVRYGTACYPCRKRKVKCDNQQPCQNCVRRDHANLCAYKPQAEAATRGVSPTGTGNGNSNDTTPAPSSRKRSHAVFNEREPSVPMNQSRYKSSDEEEPTSSRYVGRNSTLAFLSSQARPDGSGGIKNQDVIRKDILPILGLQSTSAPYPFMANERIDKIKEDISAALPDDREVLQKFQLYRQVVHPFWHLLINIDEFESRLCTYLEERTSRRKPVNAKPVSMGFLGTLFAVLALATQYSDLVLSKRVAISQSLIQTSFQCLRLQNFLLRPNLETIQALMLVGLVLSNDMKAEASWAFLGLTARLAQSLGLHKADENLALVSGSSVLHIKQLWGNVVWHDTLLSMIFDRPSVTCVPKSFMPTLPENEVEGLSYNGALYALFGRVSGMVNADSSESPNFLQITQEVEEVESIFKLVNPRLRSKEHCRTIQDRLQYYALRLHISYIVTVLCRPALSRTRVDGDVGNQKEAIAEKCKANLAEIVRMFLHMHPLSTLPTRSWSFIHHGLSAAVLLGILGETRTNPEVRELQGQLINVMLTTAHGDQDTSLSGPLSRALTALRNMYEYGTINGQTAPSSAVEEPATQRPQDQAAIDQQNAALAMTSLQNGNEGLVPSVDFNPQMVAPDLQTVDQSLEMSPMDLFDSIFWDPTMANLDPAAAFDYSQQFYPF